MHTRSMGRSGLAWLFLLLSACGGGAGGGGTPGNATPPSGSTPSTTPGDTTTPTPGDSAPPTSTTPGTPSAPSNGSTFQLSTESLTFATANINVTPPAQTLNAVVPSGLSGTLYILVEATGAAVLSVDDFSVTTSTSGHASVVPAVARGLGVGTHSSTIRVTACTNDPTCVTGQLPGSPRSVNVTYTISSTVQGDVVMPRVVTSNESGEVILRGRGFNAVSSVHFGATPATGFTVVSDSEIHASYGALPAGSYPVILNSGAVPFDATLVAVDAPSYAVATLQYPSPPLAVTRLRYDSQRRALFVALRQSQAANNQLLRFDYQNGAWSTPQATTVPNLRDIALAPDGAVLLAVTDTAITEVNPDTLASGASYTPVFSWPPEKYLNNVEIANDGYALVTTNINGSGLTELFLYSTSTHAIYTADWDLQLSRGSPAVSGDGSWAVLQQRSTLGYVHQYLASTQIVSATTTDFPSSSGARGSRASLDRAGTRVVLLNNPNTRVYDRNFQVLGSLPSSYAAVVKPDATRAYTLIYDSAAGVGELRSFDLTAAVASGAYPQVGSGIAVNPGISSDISDMHPVAMTISADGGAIFIAGISNIEVRPSLP